MADELAGHSFFFSFPIRLFQAFSFFHRWDGSAGQPGTPITADRRRNGLILRPIVSFRTVANLLP